MPTEPIHSLVQVYGEDVFDLASTEIQTLKANSNIPFNTKYVELGCSFMAIKAQEILEKKRDHLSLKDLVSSSFGEAAIYKYNVNGGTLQ